MSFGDVKGINYGFLVNFCCYGNEHSGCLKGIPLRVNNVLNYAGYKRASRHLLTVKSLLIICS
jgi:hypothetical protein